MGWTKTAGGTLLMMDNDAADASAAKGRKKHFGQVRTRWHVIGDMPRTSRLLRSQALLSL